VANDAVLGPTAVAAAGPDRFRTYAAELVALAPDVILATGAPKTPLTGSPGDFGRLIADETDKWRKVIKSAGIKPE